MPTISASARRSADEPSAIPAPGLTGGRLTTRQAADLLAVSVGAIHLAVRRRRLAGKVEMLSRAQSGYTFDRRDVLAYRAERDAWRARKGGRAT